MTEPTDQADDLAERLTRVERRTDYPNLRPRDAATLLILDKSDSGHPKVLMGRRHHNHKFMPGKFVFPGGRVDPSDSRMRVARDYDPTTRSQLMFDMKRLKSEARARGLAVAAIRETYEEAGLFVGRKQIGPVAAGPGFDQFAARNIALDLSCLRFIGRAITPPRRPRRFDTRFFAAFADCVVERMPAGVLPSGELEDLHWIPLEQAKTLDLPTITSVMIEELLNRLRADPDLDPTFPVPYYAWSNRRFNRTRIPATAPART